MNRSLTRNTPWRALLALLALAAVVVSLCVPVRALAETDTDEMFRLYNPYTGEHLYTSNFEEIGTCVTNGWRYEGEAWTAPSKSNTPVYRLYNKYSGDHHYTTSKTEYEKCAAAGWNKEGIGWYSDDAKTVPIYRGFNPYEKVGTHHYTSSSPELQTMVKNGWKDEGVGWYAVGGPDKVTTYDESAKTAAQAGLKVSDSLVVVYRLYNMQSNANYYTTDVKQIGLRITGDYIYKGAAWLAPKKSNNPVYQLYNSWSYEYIYVTGGDEYNSLTSAGWKSEGIAFYATDSKTDAPIYRLYNPKVYESSHLFTGSAEEVASLKKSGWNYEGINFYAIAAPKEEEASLNHYAIADSDAGKVYLYNSSDTLVKTIDCQFTGGRRWIGEHTVCRKARGYWADEYCNDVNDWWVCFIDATTNSNDNGKLRPLGDGKYEDGAGFHYGFSGSGCVVIGNKDDAKFVYDFLEVGSKVICK